MVLVSSVSLAFLHCSADMLASVSWTSPDLSRRQQSSKQPIFSVNLAFLRCSADEPASVSWSSSGCNASQPASKQPILSVDLVLLRCSADKPASVSWSSLATTRRLQRPSARRLGSSQPAMSSPPPLLVRGCMSEMDQDMLCKVQQPSML
eukprot:1145112-Pelagomonas_calceolata.AAC.20